MLVAELFHKVSRNVPPSDRLEDVLTSNVFSAFRYFGPVPAIIAWLGGAKNLQNRPLGLEGVNEVTVFFWPRVTLGSRTREPDVLLVMGSTAGDRTALAVEVKYDSGPSDSDSPEDADTAQVAMTGNQLADTYLGVVFGEWKTTAGTTLMPLVLPSDARRLVVYVTGHYETPTESLCAGVNSVTARLGDSARSEAECALYWVSWRDLTRRLNRHCDESPALLFLTDLHDMLFQRRLSPFDVTFDNLRPVGHYVGIVRARQSWSRLAPLGRYRNFVHT